MTFFGGYKINIKASFPVGNVNFCYLRLIVNTKVSNTITYAKYSLLIFSNEEFYASLNTFTLPPSNKHTFTGQKLL